LMFSLTIPCMLPLFRTHACLKFMPPLHRIPYSHYPRVTRCILLSSGHCPSVFGIGESYSRCLIGGSLPFISFRLTEIHFHVFFSPFRSAPSGLPPTAPKGGLETVPVKPSLAVHRTFSFRFYHHAYSYTESCLIELLVSVLFFGTLDSVSGHTMAHNVPPCTASALV
jgi:hypothetical protein